MQFWKNEPGKKQNKDRKKPLKPKRKGSAAQPQQVAEPVVEIQVEKVQEDVVAVSAPVEPVPAEPTPSISSNPAPSPTTRGNIPNASEDEWSQRIKQRLKQISIAKVWQKTIRFRTQNRQWKWWHFNSKFFPKSTRN